MADTKITALTALTAADPANDVIPIVDVSDTTMAASGTTKKISVNNILSSSPTASGALTVTGLVTAGSATITGALTVQSNVNAPANVSLRYGPSGATWAGLRFDSTNQTFLDSDIALIFRTGGATSFTTAYQIGATGISTWSVGGTTAMTLNSTGLGVGNSSPAAALDLTNTGVTASREIRIENSAVRTFLGVEGSSGRFVGSAANNAYFGCSGAFGLEFATNNNVRMVVDSSGNVGIGVTPSAWATLRGLQNGRANLVGYVSNSEGAWLTNNAFYDGSWKYQTSAQASHYQQLSGVHSWSIAGTGTAGNAITFTQAMTLTAGGDLLVGSALPVSGGRISGNSSTGPAGRFFSSAGDNQFAAMFDKSSATNTTSQFLIGFTINNQATGSGQINANGASQAAFGTFSDSRLKENIVSLPSQLANILSLRPVEFDYKDGSGHQIGFVAQEMQEVYSDAVGEQNGFLTVTGWSKTEARLVSAIKELAAKVQALEAKLA